MNHHSTDIPAKETFRLTKLPWILFAAGSILTVAGIIWRLSFTPEDLALPYVLLLAIGGIIGGIALGLATNKKLKSASDYLSMMKGMRISWVVSLILLALSWGGGYAYILAIVLNPLCAAFFVFYLPRYTELRVQKYVSAHTTR